MKKISDIPYDEEVKINENSKVVHASSFGLGGFSDEIRIIVCDKKLVCNDNGFKIINESNLQLVISKKTAKDLKNLLDEYID